MARPLEIDLDDAALSPLLDFDAPPPDAPLLLPGRAFPLDFRSGALAIAGAPLFIVETPNSQLGTGLNVWDGAVVLAKHLEARRAHQLPGARVLELGAGPGVAGLAAAALGASVTLTDLPYVLPNLREAVALNTHLRGPLAVAELDWFAPQAMAGGGGFDLVLGSDVVWVEELIPPLVNTLALLLRQRPGCEALLAHQTRSRRGDALLTRLLGAAGVRVRVLPRGEHHADFSVPAIELLSLTLARDE